MNVVMPLFTTSMTAVFHLHPVVETTLIALAVSPIPPLLPKRVLKVGGDKSYTIGLLVAASLFAIFFVPLVVDLLGIAFGGPAKISHSMVMLIVGITMLEPLVAGMLARLISLSFAERVTKPISRVASVLIIDVVPIFLISMPTVMSMIGNGTLVGIVAFILMGLSVGHLPGGPKLENRTVLALMTSSRHPGIAVAIANTIYPEKNFVIATVLLYLLLNMLISFPYLIWSKRRNTKMTIHPKLITETM
jgi:BASS family bile acid:Na+ symporter